MLSSVFSRMSILTLLLAALGATARAQDPAEIIRQTEARQGQGVDHVPNSHFAVLLRKIFVQAMIALRSRSQPPLTDAEIERRAGKFCEECGHLVIDHFFANNGCKTHQAALLERGEFDAEEFMAALKKRREIEEQLARCVLDFASLPSDEAREYGRLLLDGFAAIYNANRSVELQLQDLLVDGRLPAASIERAKQVLIDAVERARSEPMPSDKAIQRAIERVKKRFPGCSGDEPKRPAK